MTFEVRWTPPAEAEFLGHLGRAPQPSVLLRAAYRIEAVLGTCPTRAGESRNPGERTFFDRPLSVYYTVDAANQQVFILHVHLVEE